MDIKRTGAIGSCTMGSGTAQAFAQNGYDTIVIDLDQKFLGTQAKS